MVRVQAVFRSLIGRVLMLTSAIWRRGLASAGSPSLSEPLVECGRVPVLRGMAFLLPANDHSLSAIAREPSRVRVHWTKQYKLKYSCLRNASSKRRQ